MGKNAIKHPLHVKIGYLLEQAKPQGSEVILDEAAGGSQQISLFVENIKNRENRLCKVDAMIVANGHCKVVVEIEESGFIPTKVCGKYLTTALSTNYIRGKTTIPLHTQSVIFIQVIQAEKFTPEKKEQLRLIAEQINKQINNLQVGCVKHYELLLVETQTDSELKKEVELIIQQL